MNEREMKQSEMFGVVLAISVHPYASTHASQDEPVHRVMWGCTIRTVEVSVLLKYN